MIVNTGTSFAGENEHSVFVEIAGSGEWGLVDGYSYGPELGLEFMVAEHILEIELSTSPLFSKGQAGIGTDLIFKKPFDLSESTELEIGGGPEWVHKTGNQDQADSVAAVAAVEFIYTPSPGGAASFLLEPTYSYDFGKGHERSMAVTAGLLIAVK